MKPDNQLYAVLQDNLPFHKARVKFIALFVLALIKTPTVNFVKLALALNSNCKIESNYRRIQRFFAHFDFDSRIVGKVVYALLPQHSNLVIAIDRTEWKSGDRWINLLIAGVHVQGLNFPLVWFKLSGQRCSTTPERIELVSRVLEILPTSAIKALVADREFIGYCWFRWLLEQEIPFYIRFRMNANVGAGNKLVQIKSLFAVLVFGLAGQDQSTATKSGSVVCA